MTKHTSLTNRTTEDSTLALLAAANPEPPSPRRLDPAWEPLARRIAHSPRPAPTPPARPRRRLAAMAAAAAAATLITAAAAAAILPTGSGGPDPAAAAALSHLSQVAAAQAPLADGYIYTKATSTDLQIIGCPHPSQCGAGPSALVTYTVDRVVQTWVNDAGTGRYRAVTSTPHLSAAAAARLRSWGQPIPTTPATTDEPLTAAPEPVATGDWSLDPAVLASQIATRFEAGHEVPSATADFATQLLTTATSPHLRSALFSVLANTPGITIDGAVSDPLGRPGQAFHDITDGVKTTWIIDPGTSHLLSRESVLIEPAKALAPAHRNLPAGAVLSETTFSSPETTTTPS